MTNYQDEIHVCDSLSRIVQLLESIERNTAIEQTREPEREVPQPLTISEIPSWVDMADLARLRHEGLGIYRTAEIDALVEGTK